MEIWKFQNMEIPKYGNMEIPEYGNMEIPEYGNMEIPEYGNSKIWKVGNSRIWKYGNSIFVIPYSVLGDDSSEGLGRLGYPEFKPLLCGYRLITQHKASLQFRNCQK